MPSLESPAELSSAAASGAGAGRSPAADPWVQVFVCLAVMSGGLWAYRSRASAAAGAAPPAAPAATAVSDAPPPAVGPDPALPAAAPGPAPEPQPAKAPPQPVVQVSGPGASVAGLAPKTPGRWVVDAEGGAGSDSATLAPVLAAAKDGDIISVRPGRYREALVVSRSVTIQGIGASPADVVLDSDGPLTVAVAAGKPLFKNLTISNSGSPYTTALSVVEAEAALEGVKVKAVGQGARVSRGSLTVSRSALQGRIGVIVEEDGTLGAADCQVSGTDVGALLKGDAINASFSRCSFFDSERAVNIEGRSRLVVADSGFSLTGVGGGIFAFAGAQATVTRTGMDLRDSSRVGLYAQNATVEARGLSVKSSRRSGVIATGESTVLLEDSRLTRNAAAGVSAEGGSRVTLRRTTLADNSDCGLQLNDAVAILDHAVVERDRCGAGFFGPGSLRADHSTFAHLALGPVAVAPGYEDKVKLSGKDDQGFVPKQPAAATAPAGVAGAAGAAGSAQQAEPNWGRTRFSHDIFANYDQRWGH